MPDKTYVTPSSSPLIYVRNTPPLDATVTNFVRTYIENVIPRFIVDMLSSSMTALPSDPVPDFKEPIQNVTVAVGREAILSCSVTELGHYRVS